MIITMMIIIGDGQQRWLFVPAVPPGVRQWHSERDRWGQH